MSEVTTDEAAAMICPVMKQEGGPGRLTFMACRADKCMAWRWSYAESDGFEEHRETTLDWVEAFFDDGSGGFDTIDEDQLENLRAWLAITLGDDAAKSAVDKLADVQEIGCAEWETAVESINTDLEVAYAPKLDEWAERKRPEGDGWGLKTKSVRYGLMVAIYQRPAKKRGHCGMAGR